MAVWPLVRAATCLPQRQSVDIVGAVSNNDALGALLNHLVAAVSDAAPPDYSFELDGMKLRLLRRGQINSTTDLSLPARVEGRAVDADGLRWTAFTVLDEAQDLLVSTLNSTWPDRPSHPVAFWDDEGGLRMGYYPSGDGGQSPVVALPTYKP